MFTMILGKRYFREKSGWIIAENAVDQSDCTTLGTLLTLKQTELESYFFAWKIDIFREKQIDLVFF